MEFKDPIKYVDTELIKIKQSQGSILAAFKDMRLEIDTLKATLGRLNESLMKRKVEPFEIINKNKSKSD